MIMMLFGIGFLNLYPISRAAGAMYQSARGNAEVRVSFLKKRMFFNPNKIKIFLRELVLDMMHWKKY